MDLYWEQGPALFLSSNEMAWVRQVCARIQSPFVSVDLARRQDGQLMVMELGDGQVSGLQQIAAEKLYKALRRAGERPGKRQRSA